MKGQAGQAGQVAWVFLISFLLAFVLVLLIGCGSSMTIVEPTVVKNPPMTNSPGPDFRDGLPTVDPPPTAPAADLDLSCKTKAADVLEWIRSTPDARARMENGVVIRLPHSQKRIWMENAPGWGQCECFVLDYTADGLDWCTGAAGAAAGAKPAGALPVTRGLVSRPPVEALVGAGTLCPTPSAACWNWKVQGPSRRLQ